MRIFQSSAGMRLIAAMMMTAGIFAGSSAHALPSSAARSAFEAYPPVNSTSVPALVMLAMSNDHQLYFKAYTDWDDLDGDGLIDATYNDTVDYYGYFDPAKCYTYSGNVSSGQFAPAAMASGPNNHHCDSVSNAWSGNFLNWLSMSRMDVLRKSLYGGYRSTDSDSLTVLERAYLPTDNHAWSKYFGKAADLHKYTPYHGSQHQAGLSFCNVTPRGGSTDRSETNTTTPRLRVASGLYAEWAAQEERQCGWRSEHSSNESPASHHQVAELTVRVEVCKTGLVGTENCRSYTDGSKTVLKPIGLLQTYGDAGKLEFGLITGSYGNNKSGGVLRKNISPLGDEIDELGRFIKSNGGIIDTVDRFRISRYSYTQPGYHGNSPDNCPYGRNSWNNGSCINWGNPVGEIYLEALRYFAGATGGNFGTNDSNYISGLRSPSWVDPFGPAQTSPTGGGHDYCARPKIITFSTGVVSFDHDEYEGARDVAGLSGQSEVVAATKTVGDLEGITGNRYYVGSTSGGGAPTDVCTSEVVDSLGTVTGVCPEAAGLQGSYNIAGLAYHARTNDLRPDLSEGKIVAETFAVALSPPIPELKLKLGDREATLIPVGYNHRDNNAMILVNFVVEEYGETSGRFFMNYENAPAGADYDSDMKGYLEYSIDGDELTVTMVNTGSSSGATQHMGYIIDGVQDSGTFYLASNRNVLTNTQHASNDYSTTYDTVWAACRSTIDQNISPGDARYCQTRIMNNTDRHLAGRRVHKAGDSTTRLLNNPLWYAAKYGGFVDKNGNGIPDLLEEWDALNEDGQAVPDGIPDNYFRVTNPRQLEQRLGQVFNAISNEIAAGSAAAVVSNNSTGEGAVYQALYMPELTANNRSVQWAGALRAFFIDSKNRFREDSNGDGQLNACADMVLRFEYNEMDRTTYVYRTPPAECGGAGDVVRLDQVRPIWSAQDTLMALDDGQVLVNRPNYSDSATNGRYIITGYDTDADGFISADDVRPFEPPGAGLVEYFNVDNEDEARVIVDFIRGKDGELTRSRKIDLNGDGTLQTYRLGDIIHSSPHLVARPRHDYNARSDHTYQEFVNKYRNRRQVVYVGANDGMLHAFNAGFYDRANYRFDTEGNHGETAHPLGAELWAYVPGNLHPHLKWLTQPDYGHVYYVDGEPISFDARIFQPDEDHPFGWGTVLVVGMRLGGGPMDLDLDGDGVTDFTSRSAYLIFDVTNPEKPPRLLGEITDADLGFTTSVPAVVTERRPGAGNNWLNPAASDWYLIFGSGPNVLNGVTSSQTSRLYRLKLNDLTAATPTKTLSKYSVTNTPGFIGDINATDWDNGIAAEDGRYGEDAVYFGWSGTPSDQGAVYRFDLRSESISLLYNTGQSVIAAPTTALLDGTRWVYFGSGRTLHASDLETSDQHSFWGVKDDGTITNLLRTNGIDVYTDGSLKGTLPLNVSPTFEDLKAYMQSDSIDGWYHQMPNSGGPSTRVSTRATRDGPALLFTGYSPEGTGSCDSIGRSSLYGLSVYTGTALPTAVLGEGEEVNEDNYHKAPTHIDIGAGDFGAGQIHHGTGQGLGAPDPSEGDDDDDDDDGNGDGGDTEPGEGEGGESACPAGTTIILQGSGGNVIAQCVFHNLIGSERSSWRELLPSY